MEETNADIKRVGKSGQLSLGKKYAGQYFREERRKDGAFVLIPVVVVDQSDWSVRDADKIDRALEWAKSTPARKTDLKAFLSKAKEKRSSST